jgi:hypothetical protein
MANSKPKMALVATGLGDLGNADIPPVNLTLASCLYNFVLPIFLYVDTGTS